MNIEKYAITNPEKPMFFLEIEGVSLSFDELKENEEGTISLKCSGRHRAVIHPEKAPEFVKKLKLAEVA